MNERPKRPTAEDERMIRWASDQLNSLGYTSTFSWRRAKGQYDIVIVLPKVGAITQLIPTIIPEALLDDEARRAKATSAKGK